MDPHNPAKSSSYSKLNDWNQSKQTPLVARRSKLSRWKRVFVCLVILACIVFIGLGIGFGLSKIHAKKNPSVAETPFAEIYSHGAVSSQSPNCSIVGRDILMKNGSAVDAAIATLICEGAYSPQSSGMGGGFFMLVYSKANGSVKVIDARETAPAAATLDLYRGNASLIGGLAVAVPGQLKGYQLAHQAYGRLNWSDLFQSAIAMCREGITVSPRLSYTLHDGHADKVQDSPTVRAFFTRNDTGELVKTGDVFYCLELAETLEIIAEDGADQLYTGELSRKLLKDLESLGGIITAEDLKNYKAVVRDAALFRLNDKIEVLTVPPPGGGLVLGLLMQILDKIAFNVTYGLDELDDMQWTQYFVEACKYAYAKRAEIADPSFEDMTELMALMTNPHLAERIKNSIQQDKTFDPEHYEAMFAPQNDHGTLHISVLAPNGDAVSVTSTLNTGLGAVIRSPSTGIIFNSQMGDFSYPSLPNVFGLPANPSNYLKPGKRPSSTMAPAFVFDGDGQLTYVLGALGGSKIASAAAYVYMLHEYRHVGLEDAVRSLRVHHQLIPNVVQYEEGFDEEILAGLKQRGHNVTVMTIKPSVYLIHRNAADGKIVAVADPRRNSTPAGF